MKKIVEKYNCGMVSKSFVPASLADELSHLTVDKIMFYKERSHRAAQELCADTSRKRVQEVFHELLCSS
jgi:hypothetical protein